MSTENDSRNDASDLEAILSVWNDNPDEATHAVRDAADAIFSWDYEKGARPALGRLYEKAKSAQWNGETEIDWSIEVDPTRVMVGLDGRQAFGHLAEVPNSPLRKFSQAQWDELTIESLNWRISQFLHGEQGGLLCTAKIVESVPWMDAKYCAATQVMDEARHVEVFAKYIDTKLTGFYPINAHLKMLLDDIVTESRWDITYLGMQIMVEGLALAAFGLMISMSEDPLLKQILRNVMADEARHVAFGVLSLKEYYAELSDAEMRDRQEFALEAALRMRKRFLQQEVWERMGVDRKEVARLIQADGQKGVSGLLFTKIIPNCKRLGLLDANNGWLRKRFEENGLIGFEDWVDEDQEQLEQALRS